MRSEKSLIAVVLTGCASAALAAWIYGPGSLREARLDVPPLVDRHGTCGSLLNLVPLNGP